MYKHTHLFLQFHTQGAATSDPLKRRRTGSGVGGTRLFDADLPAANPSMTRRPVLTPAEEGMLWGLNTSGSRALFASLTPTQREAVLAEYPQDVRQAFLASFAPAPAPTGGGSRGTK